MTHLGTLTFRADGLAILRREGAPDVVCETTTLGELPLLLRETYGAGARLVGRPSGARGLIRADVVRVDHRRAAA